MAMAQTSAEYIAYPLDTTALSNLIDELVAMTKNINAPEVATNEPAPALSDGE